MSIKAHDHTTVALCFSHHDEWHRASGAFRLWHREKRRAWAEQQITRTQEYLGLPFDAERDRLDEALEVCTVSMSQI